VSAKAAIPQKRAIPEHPTTIVWRHGVPFMRVILLIVGVIIGDVHNHLTHPQPPKRLQRHQQLRHHLRLKANQANLGIVKAMVTAMAMVMAARKNVRQGVVKIGLAMVFVIIRALILLVTMMMVTAQPHPQLVYQQHLLRRGSRHGYQRNSRRGHQRENQRGSRRGSRRRIPLHIYKEVPLPDQ